MSENKVHLPVYLLSSIQASMGHIFLETWPDDDFHVKSKPVAKNKMQSIFLVFLKSSLDGYLFGS